MILIFCDRPELKATYEEILADFSPVVMCSEDVFLSEVPHAGLIIVDGNQGLLKKVKSDAIILFVGYEPSLQDDVLFLPKPLSSSVLWARVDVLFRRIQNGLLAGFNTEKYTFNAACRMLNQITLTQKETNLIEYLYENKNRTVGKDELLEAIFGYKEGVQTHTLETHIYKLRQKIGEKEDGLIQTCDGGYRLNLK